MIKISLNPSSRARCAEDIIPMPTWTLGLTNAPATRKFLLLFFYSHIQEDMGRSLTALG